VIAPDDEPEWARLIDAAYLNGEYAHVFRDLRQPQEAATFAALSAQEAERQHRARRGSLAHATLARAALLDRDLELAAAEATTTVELAAKVRSSRSIEAVHELRATFGATSSHPQSPDSSRSRTRCCWQQTNDPGDPSMSERSRMGQIRQLAVVQHW